MIALFYFINMCALVYEILLQYSCACCALHNSREDVHVIVYARAPQTVSLKGQTVNILDSESHGVSATTT